MGGKGGEDQIVKQSSSTKDLPQEEPAGGGLLPRNDQQQHTEGSPNPNPNPTKRVRYGTSSAPGQWKPVNPSSGPPNFQPQPPRSSSPTTSHHQTQLLQTTADSSSPTPSSPSNSPRPSFSAVSGQHHQTKPRQYLQLRKGKYVSSVWKPHEMLWLARAWRLQYSASAAVRDGGQDSGGASEFSLPSGRGKSRAEKDKEVSNFLNTHGVNRDAKTAGTKWDNMLGEFRKVYEWEREQAAEKKSYFRLSPYERKIHRLPASFDEEVYQELSQFMGLRTRPSHRATASSSAAANPFRDHHLSYKLPNREDSIILRLLPAAEAAMGENSLQQQQQRGGCTSAGGEMRRLGKVRLTWDEWVSVWSEEEEEQEADAEGCGGGGVEPRSGRLRLEGLSFLNAEELTYLDETLAGSRLEAFEEGPLRGFSVDRFVCGQQIKVFGRSRRSSDYSYTGGGRERVQQPPLEPPIRSVVPMEYQDRTEYFVGCLRVPTTSTLPSLLELSWHLQEPPPEEFRFPLRREVFRDLPPGKDLFFTPSSDLDCRSFVYEIVGPLIRPATAAAAITTTSRDSFISLWDDCINRIIARFCFLEILFIRKPNTNNTNYILSCTPSPCSTNAATTTDNLCDQWPNLTGFIKNLCLWRGEEVDQVREGGISPSSTILDKLLWTYGDLPYLLGYYAIGHNVTFCALTGSHPDRTMRTDLLTIDLSTPSDRLKALVPCWRISNLLPLLADHCTSKPGCLTGFEPGSRLGSNPGCLSDYQRLDRGCGCMVELTPTLVKKLFPNKRRWAAVKEIYDFLDHRVPHAESLCGSIESELGLVFKPRGCGSKPTHLDQLIGALKFVTKSLVALHDLCFMHRDLSWENVLKRIDREEEWFVVNFEEAMGSPQIYPHVAGGANRAPEMARGVHGVKVDVWGVGHLIKTSGLAVPPHHPLRDLQNRCLEPNPEQRPTAADCYHHLLQMQSSLGAF